MNSRAQTAFAMYFVFVANILLAIFYLIPYFHIKDKFCQSFYIKAWESFLMCCWPSASSIISGMKTQLGEKSACMYYVYTYIILFSNVIFVIIAINLMMRSFHLENLFNNKKIVLLKMSVVMFFIGVMISSFVFFFDRYNYRNHKIVLMGVLDANSLFDGAWNIIRISILISIVSFTFAFIVTLTITITKNYLRDKNAEFDPKTGKRRKK